MGWATSTSTAMHYRLLRARQLLLHVQVQTTGALHTTTCSTYTAVVTALCACMYPLIAFYGKG